MDSTMKKQLRHAAYDIAVFVAMETALARVAHRLRHGRRCTNCGAADGRHRPVRRLMGAVVHEIGATSATGIYMRRQRMRVAVDRIVAGLEEDASHRSRGYVRIPRQRHAHQDVTAEVGRATTP